VQGRQGIEETGRLSSRCPSAVKLVLLVKVEGAVCSMHIINPKKCLTIQLC